MVCFNSKSEYRIWAKGLKKNLDLKKISNEIIEKIRHLPEYKSSKTIMAYLAKDIEISLNELFTDKSKDWFLPRIGSCRDTTLCLVPYIPVKTNLIKNKFDILEPEIINDGFYDQVKKKIKLDLIFVPGLCFDKSGNRIGFGKGYYDNFLKLNPNSFKIGCCPKECLVDKLPTDKWDEKIDLVVSG